mmetsp:Transcript_2987/g.7447  ORF Transcript_2987/g.7447 Transcript_2987/m.7447 type:complete len:138 (-) Transcript_2987:158-571(-)
MAAPAWEEEEGDEEEWGAEGAEVDEDLKSLDVEPPLSPAQIVEAIQNGSTAISWLNHAEGSKFAFTRGSGVGAASRLFVDGEEIAFGPDAAEHVRILCSSSRVSSKSLRPAFDASKSFSLLVEELLLQDLLWADLPF